jgi:ABC-type multidrug transport system fused ATPase/permease subunit
LKNKKNTFDWLKRAYGLGLNIRLISLLIFLSLLSTVTEIFGIGMFLPIFQFIRLEGEINALVSDSSFWQYVFSGFSYLNIEPSLLALLLISFAFFLGRQVFVYIRLVYKAAVTQSIVQALRNRMFNGYIEANTSYHDSIPVGNLVNVITTEVNAAVAGVMAPIELMVYVVMLIGYLVVLFALSWKMTLVSVVVLILASRIPNLWIKKSTQIGRKLVNANTLMSEFLVGRLRSPRLVRLSGTEIAEQNEFHQLTQKQRKHAVLGSILQARTEVAMEPVVIGLSLTFLYFSYTLLQLQIEVIGLYLVVALRLMPVVKGIILQWQSVQRYLGSIEVIENRLKVMKAAKEVDSGSKLLNELKENIIFNKVSYRYLANDRDVLKNITIRFAAGTMTAVVGPSGSGKSTLIDLLPRLRLPTEGRIEIDGENVEKYKLKTLRQLISYVPQSPQIFDGTIKNHILYGKVDATDKELQEAAHLAGAKKFIDLLPLGFETLLGEDAIKLSGGQRQRLDLARALVSKAEILILDEPTSNLDAESEELFKQVLTRIHKETNITIIIVVHRLASIIDADQIVVLNQGTVEDIGEHAELLKKKGWYSKAWKMQNLSNHL